MHMVLKTSLLNKKGMKYIKIILRGFWGLALHIKFYIAQFLKFSVYMCVINEEWLNKNY